MSTPVVRTHGSSSNCSAGKGVMREFMRRRTTLQCFAAPFSIHTCMNLRKITNLQIYEIVLPCAAAEKGPTPPVQSPRYHHNCCRQIKQERNSKVMSSVLHIKQHSAYVSRFPSFQSPGQILTSRTTTLDGMAVTELFDPFTIRNTIIDHLHHRHSRLNVNNAQAINHCQPNFDPFHFLPQGTR